MKKILYLLADNAPSTTVRAKAFQKYFAKAGFVVDYMCTFSPVLNRVISLLGPASSPARLVRKLQNKVINQRVWSRVGSYDGIIAIKNFPGPYLQRIKQRTRAPVLYDFDDALWLEAHFGPQIFRDVIQAADYVSCDNEYLAERARELNPRVFVLDSPAPLDLFPSVRPPRPANGDIVLGWVGSPSTLLYLYAIYEALETIGCQYPQVRLKLVGTGEQRTLLPPFERIRFEKIAAYDQADMVTHVNDMDVGLYPLFDNELSLGRGTLKARIYMTAGVPAVCSALGDNQRLIQDGDNGFLAGSKVDWVARLSTLIESRELRERMGHQGRKTVESRYTGAKCFQQLLDNYLAIL